MVLDQYLGPARPPLLAAARALSDRLTALGLTPPPEAALVDAFILTFLFLLITLPLLRPKRDSRHAVLLVGISGDADAPAVGKTSLFTYLQHGALPKHGTVPSMLVNDAVFAAVGTSTQLRWVDFPGHPRLRHTLSPYLAAAKCIIFVVDAASFTAHARKDAELLYDILTNPVVATYETPLLIFCNKSDLPNTAKTVAVQTRLEAELERARNASTAALRSASVGEAADGEREEERAFLGYENEPFAFDHAPGPVSIGAGSALTGDVQAITNFVKSSFL